MRTRTKRRKISTTPLFREWDFAKNQNLDPRVLTEGSNFKAWWVCKKGHTWSARISSRGLRGTGCPRCANIGLGGNISVSFLKPQLVKNWDYQANGGATPENTSALTTKKIHWKCFECGLKYAASPGAKCECPACAPESLRLQSLEVLFPQIAKEFDESKNTPLTASKIHAGSKQKVWWICSNGHSFQATVSQRTRSGTGCNVCLGRAPALGESLADKHPELLSEWHTEKNTKQDPKNINPRSNKKAWWRCRDGHEWERRINARCAPSDGGCPYCSGRLAGVGTSLFETHPELEREWDFGVNTALNPNTLTQNSSLKAAWVCEIGHKWDARVYTRAKLKTKCPFCTGKKASQASNLAVLFPDIANDWNYSKNGSAAPENYRPRSSSKVWWLCSRGHEYQSTIAARTGGSGCPYCSSSTSKPEIRVFTEMLFLFPETEWRKKIEGKEVDVFISSLNLAIEIDGSYWHKSKATKDRAKTQALEAIGIKVLRIRDHKLSKLSKTDILVNLNALLDEEGWFTHFGGIAKFLTLSSHQASSLEKYIADRKLRGDKEFRTIVSALPGPTASQSVSQLFPDLAGEWDDSKNHPLKPYMFSPGSQQKIWWRCSNNHSWETAINRRTKKGSACPYCFKGAGKKRRASAEYNLLLENPELAAQWHPTNNHPLSPTNVTPGSRKKAWWICGDGHVWEATIASRNRGRGCPICSGTVVTKATSLATLHPDLMADWDFQWNVDINPEKIRPGSNQRVWWKCSTCDHRWEARVYSRSQGRGCIKCSYAGGRGRKNPI